MITLINGFPQGPNGLIVPNGSISFQLNVDATVIAAPGGFVAANEEVVFQFDSSGQIQPNSPAVAAQIYSNKELQPQNSIGLGTYYLVTFYDQNGARINKDPMWWQFPEAANATVDISQMTPISTIGGNVIFYPTSFGGGGTVTSVAFVGDGTILSVTPSTPVTTSGNIAATLLTQNPNTVLVGPATPGPAGPPTFRLLASADIPVPLILNAAAAANALTLANPTAATSLANQSSPTLVISGHIWNGSASVLEAWTIQHIAGAGTNPQGTLTFTHTGSAGAQTISFLGTSMTVGGNLTASSAIVAQVGFFLFNTGSAGYVFTISQAANAVGALTTYQAVITPGAQPTLGQNVSIVGFTTGANNGTFVVHDATVTTITVYNSAGVSETHAATGTVAGDYFNINGGFTAGIGLPLSSTYAILGTNYSPASAFQPYPNNPGVVVETKGNATDSSYWRVVNDGVTGNHGLELGAIIDGTGAAPVTLQMGHFNGISMAVFNSELQLKNSTSGNSAYIQSKTFTLTSAQIKTLFSVPTEVLPDPGANRAYAIISVLSHYRFNTTPYTLNGSGNIFIGTANTVQDMLVATNAGFIDQGADRFFRGFPNGVNLATLVHTHLVAWTDTADPTAGDGTVTFSIQYTIVDTTVT